MVTLSVSKVREGEVVETDGKGGVGNGRKMETRFMACIEKPNHSLFTVAAVKREENFFFLLNAM